MGKKNNFAQQATDYLKDLGGCTNIEDILNCASRIRVTVKDPTLVATDQQFIVDGAINVVRHGQAIQVIVGLDVPQILSVMRQLLSGLDVYDAELDEYGLTPLGEKATLLYECFGLDGNIQQITVNGDQIIVQVKDVSWVDPFDIMLQLGIGITAVKTSDHRIYVNIDDAVDIARQMLMMNRYRLRQMKQDDRH